MIIKSQVIKWHLSLMILGIIFLWLSLNVGATGVDELEGESSNLKSQLTNINQEILELSLNIENILYDIEVMESDIARTQESLVVCREDEAEQYEAMKLRIRYMYENGQSTMLEIIFGAQSISDLISRGELVSAMTEYDRDMLQALVVTREDIEFEEENLIAQKKNLIDLEESNKVKQAELEIRAKETSTDLKQVQSQIAEIREAERIAAEKAEAERIASEKAEAERMEAEKVEIENTSEEEAGLEENNTEDSVENQEVASEPDNTDDSDTNTENSYEGSTSDLDLFAAILDCEAASNYDSMLAVATVIMNRVSSSKFPNSINGVVYQSGQFSPVKTGKLDRIMARGGTALAYRVAQDAMNGSRLDKVSHCYYFLTASSTSRSGVSVGGNLFFSTW